MTNSLSAEFYYMTPEEEALVPSEGQSATSSVTASATSIPSMTFEQYLLNVQKIQGGNSRSTSLKFDR